MKELTRLHVTPLDPSLLPVVLGPTIRDQAIDISLHTIPTFPEHNYGFFSLPPEHAGRLRKKLHGSVVKGRRMKVEDARPKRGARGADSTEETVTSSTRNVTSKPLRSQAQGVIPAIELSNERKVKRGWTGTEKDSDKAHGAAKKDRTKRSKGKDTSITGNAECLFKTKVPPTAANSEQHRNETPRKRKRLGNSQEVVVHEFQHAKKPAKFLKNELGSTHAKATKEYVEGKGWADDEGNLLEKARKRRQSNDAAPDKRKGDAKTVETVPSTEFSKGSDGEETSSSGTSSADSDGEGKGGDSEDATGNGGRVENSKMGKGLRISSTNKNEIQTAEVERLSISRSSGSPMPRIETQPTSATPTDVHPLEALFKRPHAAASQSQTPKKPHLEVSTSFNFFDPDTEEPPNGDPSMLMPQTPFTQQDFRHRRQRSAAPTPDTALPGKTFGDVLGSRDSDEVEDEVAEEDEQATPGATRAGAEMEDQSQDKEESKNAKLFWEQRGDSNRSWKRRKREATKEKRLRDKR